MTFEEKFLERSKIFSCVGQVPSPPIWHTNIPPQDSSIIPPNCPNLDLAPHQDWWHHTSDCGSDFNKEIASKYLKVQSFKKRIISDQPCNAPPPFAASKGANDQEGRPMGFFSSLKSISQQCNLVTLKVVFHQAEFSAQNDLFFCLLTPTLRQLVFNQKKMSLRTENSA